jgi:hypothetical protein
MVYLKKHNNGVSKSVLFFIFIFGLFVATNNAKASTALSDEIQDCPETPSAFSAWFSNLAPFTRGGHTLEEFVITPSTGESDYNVTFFTSDAGIFITGDGSTQAFYNYQEAGYTYTHFVAGGCGGASSNYGSGVSTSFGSSIVIDTPILASSSDVYYLDTCNDSWQTAGQNENQETYMCGSLFTWNCTEKLNIGHSSTCEGTTPPVDPVGASCTAVFSNIPSIIDNPTGWISGIWSAVGSWFSCLFTSMLEGISTLFSNLVTAVGSMLENLFVPDGQAINSQMDDIKDEFGTQFTAIGSFYSSMKNVSSTEFEDRFAGNFQFLGRNVAFNITPFNNVPTYVPIITSLVLYLELAWFLIHKIPELFGT